VFILNDRLKGNGFFWRKKGKVLPIGNVFAEITDLSNLNVTNLTNPNFYTLLQNCIEKKRDSQKQLYIFFFEYASSICLNYAATNDDAIEIMNDGFLKIFTELKKFDCKHDNPIAAFKAWLKRIMIYTAIDHYRKNKKHSKQTEINDEVLTVAGNDETNLDKLSYKEIIACVYKLPPAYKTVFSLYVLDGFTHDEISKQLGIAIGTSKSNLSKARVHLQKMISETQKNEQYEQRAI
jgi:RNA polymerase sigma factor (sigma-70 family)